MGEKVDGYGLDRQACVEIADAEVAEARHIGRDWAYPTGFSDADRHRKYLSLLHSATALYGAAGLRLMASRVRGIARDADVPKAWARFDRLNSEDR
jgi:hypothetical protein